MINNVVLMGRLTADPVMKKTGAGTDVTSFGIAVQRARKNQNGERDSDFFNIVAFGKTAEMICKWFDKGQMIGIIGELRQRRWTDNDGNNRQAIDVIVNQVSFCGSAAKAEQAEPEGFAEVEADEDLPF